LQRTTSEKKKSDYTSAATSRVVAFKVERTGNRNRAEPYSVWLSETAVAAEAARVRARRRGGGGGVGSRRAAAGTAERCGWGAEEQGRSDARRMRWRWRRPRLPRRSAAAAVRGASGAAIAFGCGGVA